jgi:DNA repair protein RadC
MSVDGFTAAGDEDQAPLFDQRMFFAEQPANASALMKPPKFLGTQSDAESHFRGHRERLRSRYRDSGETALADYEVLELLLFRLIIPRRDTKPIAKALIDRFGTLGGVIVAPTALLQGRRRSGRARSDADRHRCSTHAEARTQGHAGARIVVVGDRLVSWW